MKYRELSPNEIEAYEIGYKVGNRQIVITDIEWESENEHKIYRKGYMAGLMDYKRKVNNVSKVSNINNVDIETPTTSITPTTPIGISIRNGIENKEIGGMGEKEKKPVSKIDFNTTFYAGGQGWVLPSNFRKLALTKYTETEIRAFEILHSCHENPEEVCLNDIKHKKNKIEITNYGEYEPLREQITKWIDYKKARKESYKTEQSLMSFAKKLFTLSGGNQNIADQIIEQSMANNWAGIFELKTQPKKQEKINWGLYVGEGSFLRDPKDDPLYADIVNKKD